MKKLGYLWALPFVLFLYGCATAPQSEAPAESAPAAEAPQEESKEKEPQWVTIEVEEYFVSQETVKYEDGFIDGYRMYEYDETGNILKKSQIGSDESLISEEIFSYNDDLLLVKSEFFSNENLVSYTEFTYNDKMQVIEEQYFNPKGDLLALSTYEYDAQGLRSKWISGDSGGIPMMYTEYEYNGDGNPVQMNYYMPDGELEGYTQMEYQGALLVMEATYAPNGKLEKKVEYSVEDGVVAQALHYSGNNLIRTVEYLRDAAGNAVEVKTMNRRGDVIDIVVKEYVVFTVETTVLQ